MANDDESQTRVCVSATEAGRKCVVVVVDVAVSVCDCVCLAAQRSAEAKSENFHSKSDLYETPRKAATMAAQENTEISTKFSTLNVNAVEFVPSFNYSSAASAAAVAAAAAQAPPTTQQQQQTTPVDNAVAPGTGSVPASGSATPATTPDSTGSAGSTNALNAGGGGAGTGTAAPSSAAASNSASPAQGSPVTTPSTAAAAPIEHINEVDKITANNGKYKKLMYINMFS